MDYESINIRAEKILRDLLEKSRASDIVLTTEEGLPCCSVHEQKRSSLNVEGTAAVLIDTIKTISNLLSLQSGEDNFRHMNIRTEQGSIIVARSKHFTMAIKFRGARAKRAGLSITHAKRALKKVEKLFEIFFQI
ncbi:MAG: hypothetical protein GF308_01925 [Candidatus Heimdallarchaeota archaeon]|nr:hypothetical protein [Candidatus Heimdallarchaeota archaeon]